MPCVKYKVFHCEQNRLYPVSMEFRDMEWKKFSVFLKVCRLMWEENGAIFMILRKMHIREDIWIPYLDKLLLMWIKPAGTISQICKVS